MTGLFPAGPWQPAQTCSAFFFPAPSSRARAEALAASIEQSIAVRTSAWVKRIVLRRVVMPCSLSAIAGIVSGQICDVLVAQRDRDGAHRGMRARPGLVVMQ